MKPADGMRAGDFTKCAGCGKGVMHTGLPLFWRVSAERMGVDYRAVQRTDAMEKYMGGAVAIARAFEDPVIAKPLSAQTMLVCEHCALSPKPLAVLAEEASEADARAIETERQARDAAG